MDESQNNPAEWRKPAKKDYIHIIPIIQNSRRLKKSVVYRSVVTEIGWVVAYRWMGDGTEGQKRGITKAHVETFGGNGYIHYLDCGISQV